MNISQGGFNYTIVVDWIADLFFYVDMYLTARKFVHPDEEGELIYHRTEICRIYRRSGRFWRDLVALLPADVVVAICIWFNISLSWDIVYGLRLIRLILAFTLFERFPIAIGTQSARVLRQLLKLIVANVLVIHVGGCFWHLLRAGVGETGLPLNPSLASGSAPRHWKDFVLSAYYIMCLVTSIGYGDVIPYGNWTLMYSMAFMIFGFITKGLVVAYLVAMLKNYAGPHERIRVRVDQLKRYSKNNRLSSAKTARAEAYMRHLYTNWFTPDGESGILRELIPPLFRLEVTLELCLAHLKRVPFLEGAPNGLFRALVGKLVPETVPPGFMLICEGVVNERIWLLQRGHVAVLKSRQEKQDKTDGLEEGKEVNRLPSMDRTDLETNWTEGLFGNIDEDSVYESMEPGSVFGSDCLFLDAQPADHSMITVGWVDLFSVTREDFVKCLQPFSDFSSRMFHELKAHQEFQRKATMMDKAEEELINLAPGLAKPGHKEVNSKLASILEEKMSVSEKPYGESAKARPPGDMTQSMRQRITDETTSIRDVHGVHERALTKTRTQLLLMSINAKEAIYWELVSIIFLAYFIFTIPFRIAFWHFVPFAEADAKINLAYLAVDWILDIFFFLDIWFRCSRWIIKSYQKKVLGNKKPRSSEKQAAKSPTQRHHRRGSGPMTDHRSFCRKLHSTGYFLSLPFWLDLSASLPMDILVMSSSTLSFIYLFRLNRLIRCWRIDMYMKSVFQLIDSSEHTSLSFKQSLKRSTQCSCCAKCTQNTDDSDDNSGGGLSCDKHSAVMIFYGALVLLALTHWGACAWYIVGYAYSIPEEPTSSWIYDDYISNTALNSSTTAWVPYFRSIYWALLTTTTIGYGDMVPTTWGEMAYCIVFGIIATYGYSLLLAGLTLVMDQISYVGQIFEADQKSITKLVFSRQYEVGDVKRREAVRDSLQKYFQYYWFSQQGLPSENCPVHASVPAHVRQDLVHFTIPLLAAWPYLKRVCKHRTATNLAADGERPSPRSSRQHRLYAGGASGVAKWLAAVTNIHKKDNSDKKAVAARQASAFVSAMAGLTQGNSDQDGIPLSLLQILSLKLSSVLFLPQQQILALDERLGVVFFIQEGTVLEVVKKLYILSFL